jgi:hypothetical protein
MNQWMQQEKFDLRESLGHKFEYHQHRDDQWLSVWKIEKVYQQYKVDTRWGLELSPEGHQIQPQPMKFWFHQGQPSGCDQTDKI